MQKSPLFLPILAVPAIVAALGVSSWASPGTIVLLQQATATNTPVSISPTEDSWVIVDLPADATQLEYGAEVYRLVCKACHGDKGQGLTDDWRAQWNPKDQNCWQSKCHALNHPSDGFYLPYSPAVVGPPLKIFDTALDLYHYIRKYMPWHNPDSLTEKENWSVTAYILKINGVDPGSELDAETAAKIDLRPNDSTPPLPSAGEESLPLSLNTSTPIPEYNKQNAGLTVQQWIFAFILLIVPFVFMAARLWRRST